MAGEKKTTKPERKTFIRGADGALYAMTDDDLKHFRLKPQQEEDVDKILADADADFVAGKLSSGVILQIQAANGCVKVTAASDPPPQIFTNRRI